MADLLSSGSSQSRAGAARRVGLAISAAVAGLAMLLAFLALGFRMALIEARRGEIERVVTIAARAIDPIVVDSRNGVIPRRSALVKIAGQLRSLARLGMDSSNYLFMFDYDGSDLEGPALGAVEGYAAPVTSRGSRVAPLLVSFARQGGGFVRYRVNLPEGGTRIKLSFVQGFDDMQFLIGTGFYIADLNRYVLLHSLPTIIAAVVLSALLIVLVFLSLRPYYLVFGRLRSGFSAIGSDPGSSLPVSVEGFRVGSGPRALLEDYNRMVGRVSAYEEERSKAASLLLRDIDEKKILLQEIHHRVKNNLQVIVSLLNLQAGSKSHEGCRTCIGEATGRIRGMATIHEILYESGDFSSLDFPAYVERIARTAAQATDARCSLDLCLEPLRLGLDRAMPCGLIMSEALTNSLKHGKTADGRVRIALRLVAHDSHIVMEVADSGPGFSKAFLAGGGLHGLGYTLMTSLAEQAGGAIRFENRDGAVVRLELPVR